MTEDIATYKHGYFRLYPDFSSNRNVKSERMSNRKVTVVMYHYVRDLTHSRYPEIKGLDIDLFRSQLDFLEANYTFISIEELINAIETREVLPPKAVLLTFNDSYSDHFNNVFPLLDERGIQGCFYPEIAAIQEDKVLVNHKIHFVLANAPNSSVIKDHIFSSLDDLRSTYNLESNEYYFDKLAKPSEYDSGETVFVKRMLQTELPDKVSQIIADQLFDQFVGIDEKVFSRELYLDKKQVQCMMRHGMHFGILGYNHRRYETLEREEQEQEIHRSANFLIELGTDKSLLTAGYPWGSYNRDTLDILEKLNCKVAFTTKPGIADLAVHARLELPRLDTNHVPKTRNASPDHRYIEA